MVNTEFIEALASKAPTPGGGGASAYVGVLASALASMVGNLTVGKKKYADVEERVRAELLELEATRLRLLELIDADAEPCERLVDVVFRAGDEATAVGVLDAQNHLSAVGTREKVIVEGSADTAYVKRPCGRRCESHPYWSFHKF